MFSTWSMPAKLALGVSILLALLAFSYLRARLSDTSCLSLPVTWGQCEGSIAGWGDAAPLHGVHRTFVVLDRDPPHQGRADVQCLLDSDGVPRWTVISEQCASAP